MLVANANTSIPLEYLGLLPGSAYNFSMDTYRESGTADAALKVEFFECGNLIGDTGGIPATTLDQAWATSDFLVTIPSNADAIRVVPIVGVGSSIRFDNVEVDPTPVIPPVIPNLDFEQGLANWTQFNGGGSFVEAVPTGGSTLSNSPGEGFARMVGAGGYAVIVSNGNIPIPLTDLNLTPGTDVTVMMDMIDLSGNGSGVASMKLEFFSGTQGGFPNDELAVDVDPITPSDQWQTYSFTFFVPSNIQAGGSVDGIKIVPIANISSTVGIDNVKVVTPDPPETITITDCGFDDSGHFYIEVAEGVSGRVVLTSPDLSSPFSPATGVTSDGNNRFTINSASLDANGDGMDFFQVSE